MFIWLFLLELLGSFDGWDKLFALIPSGQDQDGRRLESGGVDVATLIFWTVLFVLFAMVAGHIGLLLYACLYEHKVTRVRAKLEPGSTHSADPKDDFQTDLFSCFEDSPTCLHALFCTPCRAGDTYDAAGLFGFWSVVALWVAARFVGWIIDASLAHYHKLETFAGQSVEKGGPLHPHLVSIGDLVFGALIGAFFFSARRNLRKRLGGFEEAQPAVLDFLAWCIFPCCVVAQEARELDKAMGVRVECCCSLVNNTTEDKLVGQAVMAGETSRDNGTS